MGKIPSVVTLGTFDGVHRGHQRILHEVVRRARRLRGRSVVLAFGMPPRLTRSRLEKPVLLTTLAEKLQIFKQLGVVRTQLLVFDHATASTSPEDFFTRTIVKTLGAREMVVGPRVAFGKNRAGRLPLLRHLGSREGVAVHVVPPAKAGGKAVSSRRLRQLLTRGHVEKARTLLGYPYSVEGRVIAGSKRGRKLGFPTANLAVDPLKILPPGVFWVKTLLRKDRMPLHAKEWSKGWDGLCNVGTRPTFTPGSHRVHCEVFLLRKPPKLYGRSLRLVFLRRIRGEKRFRSAQSLQRQIARDIRQAHRWMGN